QLTLNGAVFNAVTDVSGSAEVSVPLPAGTKIDLITARFAEDDLYLSGSGATAPVSAGSTQPPGSTGNQGTDFWLMFPQNFFDGFGPAVQKLFITSAVATSGIVSIPGSNFSQGFSVSADSVTTVELPFIQVFQSDVVQAKGVRITAQQPVVVYGMNQRNATSDAFLAMPVTALGTDHYAMSYGSMSFAPSSEIGIVAAVDNTNVTLTPTVTTGSHLAGIPYSLTLNQGQTYLLQNTVPTAASDLTGSHISANKPIAVFSGHMAATIPTDTMCCADHLVEQLPPTAAWGKRFALVPLATRFKGDFFRFVAATDGTQIYLNGNLTATLN